MRYLAQDPFGDICQGWSRDHQVNSTQLTFVSNWVDLKNGPKADPCIINVPRDELSTYNGIVYKGNRIVIPTSMRKDMLKRIHKSHLGMVTSKQRAKDVIYWPGMNGQIEDTIRRCEICLKFRNKPRKNLQST